MAALDMAGLLGELARMDELLSVVCKALSSAVVKLPDDFRPVPAGISAINATSMARRPRPTISKGSRLIAMDFMQ